MTGKSRNALALTGVCVALLATTAIGHEGVKNAAVKSRMDLMQEIRAAIGVLGGMAQGKTAFDAQDAARAKATLSETATRIAPAFQANEMDPKSESSPEIWQNWQDFVAKADAMQDAASALETDTLDDLRAGIGRLGGTCSACHKAYRIEN